MVTTEQKINVTLEYFVKNQKRIMAAAKQQQVAHDNLRKGINRASVTIQKNRQIQEIAGARAGQVMRMNQEVLGKFNKEGNVFSTWQARAANRFRMMTHGARGFRMEMLGVMFFGMAMNRVFMGLIKTSLEWVGVTEILTQSLGILFLPVAELLLEWALRFLNFVLDLTEEQKKWIGVIVLVGAALGALLFVIGTLALGIGSMILAFNFSKIATIIGSSGLGGISTAASGAATKVGGLTTKLGKIAKFSGATILFGLALKDAAEGELTAALGDAMMGIGLLKGGRAGMWLGVIGFGLKLVGDEEFLSTVVAYALKIMDIFIRLGEEIGKIIVAAVTPGREYKMSADIRSAFAKGVAKADLQSEVAKSLGLVLPGAAPGAFVPTLEASERFLQERGLGDIFITNNVTGVSSPQDVQNMIDESNRTNTEDLRRLIGG